MTKMKQIYFEYRKNCMAIKMNNFNKSFFHWCFQHPLTINIEKYDILDDSVLIYNFNYALAEKIFNQLYLQYIGFE